MYWVNRVGLDNVKWEIVDDAESQGSFHEWTLRVVHGHSDPWLGRARHARSREFRPIRIIPIVDGANDDEYVAEGLPA